jgi:5-methylcytosine-specific restriction enzyme A
MPMTPRPPCTFPRCPNRSPCPVHARLAPPCVRSSHGYNDAAWNRLRAEHLKREPWCRECRRKGRMTEAKLVDHIVPWRGNEALRLNPENLQSMCWPCHSRKTARQDGGFGNARGAP